MRLTLTVALVAGLSAAPAFAQYYDPGPGYGPRPGYGPPPGYGGGGGYGPPPGYGGGGPGYGPPPGYGRPAPGYGRRGSVCVTSRGSCPMGYVVPYNTPCSCDIPGFGPKRGGSR